MRRIQIDPPIIQGNDDCQVNCCGGLPRSVNLQPFSLRTQKMLSHITLGPTQQAKSNRSTAQQQPHYQYLYPQAKSTVERTPSVAAFTATKGKQASTPPEPLDDHIQSSPLARLRDKKSKRQQEWSHSDECQNQGSLSTSPPEKGSSSHPDTTSLRMEVEQHRSKYHCLMQEYAALQKERQRNLGMFRELLGHIRSKERQMSQVEAVRRQQLDELRRKLYSK